MHAKAPTALGNVDQGRHERRQFLGQGGELIDRNQQAGQRLPLTAGQVGIEIRLPRSAQTLLAVPQFGLEAGQRPRRQVSIEIGHQTDGVRQVGADVEGAPSFVVDQYKREVVGIVRCRQGGDHRAQQLGLAGACGPRQQGVGSIGHKVDDQRAGNSHTDGSRRSRGGAFSLPAAHDGLRCRIGNPQKVGQSNLVG